MPRPWNLGAVTPATSRRPLFLKRLSDLEPVSKEDSHCLCTEGKERRPHWHQGPGSSLGPTASSGLCPPLPGHRPLAPCAGLTWPGSMSWPAGLPKTDGTLGSTGLRGGRQVVPKLAMDVAHARPLSP